MSQSRPGRVRRKAEKTFHEPFHKNRRINYVVR